MSFGLSSLRRLPRAHKRNTVLIGSDRQSESFIHYAKHQTPNSATRKRKSAHLRSIMSRFSERNDKYINNPSFIWFVFYTMDWSKRLSLVLYTISSTWVSLTVNAQVCLTWVFMNHVRTSLWIAIRLCPTLFQLKTLKTMPFGWQIKTFMLTMNEWFINK